MSAPPPLLFGQEEGGLAEPLRTLSSAVQHVQACENMLLLRGRQRCGVFSPQRRAGPCTGQQRSRSPFEARFSGSEGPQGPLPRRAVGRA